MDYHKDMQSYASVVKNSFRKAKILGVFNKADVLISLAENPFAELINEQYF